MTMPVLEHARRYVGAGLSVIPVKRDGSKRPPFEWKEYQSHSASPDTVAAWFARDEYGVAIIGGAVSGNAEFLDIESTADLKAVARRLVEDLPKLREAAWVRTPTGGSHIGWRRESRPPGNQQLAQRLVPDPTAKSGSKKEVLIETRGEGGYIIAVGSPPDCHPDRKPYVLDHGDFAHLPLLTDAEVERIYEVARSFDQLPQANAAPKKGKPTVTSGGGDRPGDKFAAETTWAEILEPRGWTRLYESHGVTHWRRPGKTDPGASATTNYADSDLLYVFSSNAGPFEDGRSYSKFAAHAELEHGGDFASAARALVDEGYGRARRDGRNGANSGREVDSAWVHLQGIDEALREELPEPKAPELPTVQSKSAARHLVKSVGMPLHQEPVRPQSLAYVV
jgi:putative DNA primase/helicase